MYYKNYNNDYNIRYMDYGGNLYLLFIVYIIGIHNKSYFQHPSFNFLYSLKHQILINK